MSIVLARQAHGRLWQQQRRRRVAAVGPPTVQSRC